ncbi:permease of the drug/metabolite transporter (DMT) superfamily [Rubidibacter lacunae KORDI 51-2]|uniref:Permease of the drug/metabolite transporter (DMT) superfamily n=1 Tax=Rubidibacter lacunae KORDI 51-2 TaxID=582515 RepID=U5DIY8_9CHRO|nr:DMT family transporter [Rubidibacter lacunae]ERN40902.1 permease of the drug/metabolite transporter (DMT) superfamily [Rubidibacter lacunae KORDI 51-2]
MANPPTSGDRKLQWIYLKLSALAVIWGGTFVAGRAVVQTIAPFSVAFCRYAIATLCLAMLVVRVEGRVPPLPRRAVLPVVVLGLTGVFGYNLLFFAGLERVPASRAALIVTTNPIFIAIAAAILFKDKLIPLQAIGAIAALLGAGIVIAQGNPLTLFARGVDVGDAYLFGCLATWVVYTLVGKYVLQFLSPLVATTYACAIGTPLLFFASLGDRFWQDWQTIPVSAWLGVAYLGVLGTVAAFVWYYEGLQAIGPARAAVFINLVPVSAVLLAAVVLGEPLTPSLLSGGVLVACGVSLVNRC